MSAQPLPARPDLDQLKRQAKELLKAWRSGPAPAPRSPRLRDAQLAIARQYGFPTWDALRAHVDATGSSGAADRPQRRGLLYDDPVPDVMPLSGPLTRDRARELAEQGVSGVRVEASIAPDALVHLADVPTLCRLDLSNRGDLVDRDLRFLEAMPWLTALSLARCGEIGDGAAAYLRGHRQLEQINLQWTDAGDGFVAALAGKAALSRVVLGRKLTDGGAARLRDLPALATPGAADSFLSVSSARTLTDEALVHIGALTGVTALDLHMSVFGSPHYTARGVAHLRQMTSLEELNIHGPLVTDAVLRGIAGVPRLRSLHSQDIASGDDGFIALGERSSLERLGARVCPRVTDRGFAAVARLPRLTSLGLGGPRLTDAAMAPLVDARALVDLGPVLFGDDAFFYIARIPRLERLTNMYNRSTTDAATRHLRNHPSLVHYSAFGTQITDHSLRVLAGVPTLESVELENCAGITDAGLGELLQLPRLRKVSAWSCINVTGSWTDSAPSGVVAKSEPGAPGHAAGYRCETLMDYPDLPMPEDAAAPRGTPRGSGLLPALACFGGHAEFEDDGLKFSIDPGIDTRWIGLITREAFVVPLRIEIVVKPITELRLVFGRHSRLLVFDAQGFPENPAPWFIELEAQRGQSQRSTDGTAPLGEWARVTLEIDERERRLFVDGELRHKWQDDFAGLRSRVAIGLRQSALTLRELKVESLGQAG